jgi:predicted ester cyclase
MKTSKQSEKESLDAGSKKGVCLEFFSAYQDLEIDRMLGLCEPEGTINFQPLGKAYQGKTTEVGDRVWSSLIDSFPDLDNTVKDQIWDETHNTVTCTVDIFGTQKKEFAGIPSKGKGFTSEHIFIFHFNEEGLIREIYIDWDHDSFVSQLTGH